MEKMLDLYSDYLFSSFSDYSQLNTKSIVWVFMSEKYWLVSIQKKALISVVQLSNAVFLNI
jgi:hypothetical protein